MLFKVCDKWLSAMSESSPSWGVALLIVAVLHRILLYSCDGDSKIF